MGAELRSLAKISLWTAASMAYARFASARIPAGKLRLVALSPVLFLLPCLPWYFSSIHLRGISAFFLAWLALFKLLLLAFGRGPLRPLPPLLPFLASAALPVKLRKPKPTSLSPSYLRLLSSFVKATLLAALVSLYKYRDQIHPYLLLSMYCLHTYLALELVLAGAAAVAVGALGMELEPQFDAPYRAASLQDFWGRRWNLMVSAILRPAAYEPVRRRWGPAAGVLAAFLVSGLMHEVMFYYLTLEGPTGEVTAFFVVHGICTAAETKARKAGWWRPPPAMAVPLTVGFVSVTGFALFFPQILRSGADERVLAECAAMMAFLERAGRWLLGRAGWV